jgi:two-component system, OmpR family, phosphate regulon sensor histidine kinase PhoR
VRHGRLLGKFFPPLMVVLLASLLLVTGFAGRAMRSFVLERSTRELETVSRLLASRLEPLIRTGDTEGVNSLCRETGTASGMRLTIILPDGSVIGDSHQELALMDNHGSRPEILAAFDGNVGSSLRYSSTLDHQRLYVAVPGTTDASAPYAVRASVSMTSVAELLEKLYLEIALAGLLMALLAGGVSFLLARRIASALGSLQQGAEAFAAGDLQRRLQVDYSAEMSAVAEAMNRMAVQLEERIGTTESQRNELEAVLTSMVEGVLAIGPDENIIRMNRCAGRLLHQSETAALGRSIQEIGRNPELTRLVKDTLADSESRQGDVFLGDDGQTLLQVQATGLTGLTGGRTGVLLVLHDVTRLRRLQTMRRDFVANVSHELKTPITSIKGFVETLLESPPTDPADTSRFLDIINRQADRLDAIIGDLLALSRLENETGKAGLELMGYPLVDVMERVIRDLTAGSGEGTPAVVLDCPEDLRAVINAPLLGQAVGNLIDNALKYSGDAEPVSVLCEAKDGCVVIHVVDTGPGIAAEHLPRIFERFYRVDKARSRQVGGTGLGLAIVKHIAQAHNGRATVSSEIGRGSTFTLTLPGEASE